MPEITKTFYARNQKEWRRWLEKNHNKENVIWLVVYKKHTGKPSLSHRESLDEAICFGWIDTTIKRIDDDKYVRCFRKRNKNSRWSNATLSYARKLIKEKRMPPAGLKIYKEGLKKPVISHNLPKNPDVPKDLERELNKNKRAKDNFYSFAPSYKRFYIYWIERAKRKETRDKRIKEVFKNSLENKKPGL